MSKIHILNSQKYGEDLSAGWDVAGNCFFVLVDDDDESPSFWEPVLGSVDEVSDAFNALGEPFPHNLRETLMDHRMQGIEQSFLFDAERSCFVTQNELQAQRDFE